MGERELNSSEGEISGSQPMRGVPALSEDERQSLKPWHRTTKDSAVRSRCEMQLLSNEGRWPPPMGQRVRFSGGTMRPYLERYQVEGLAGLVDQPRPGRPARVTATWGCRSAIGQAKTWPRLGRPKRGL